MSWTYTAFSDGTKASAESVMGNFYNARHGNLLPRDPSTGAASTATATSLSNWNRVYTRNIQAYTSYNTNGAIWMSGETTYDQPGASGWYNVNTNTLFFGNTVSSFFFTDHSQGTTHLKRIRLVLTGTAATENAIAFSDTKTGINGENIICVIPHYEHLQDQISIRWNTTTIYIKASNLTSYDLMIHSK